MTTMSNPPAAEAAPTPWRRPRPCDLREVWRQWPRLRDRTLPAGWLRSRGGGSADDGAWYRHPGFGLYVIESFAQEGDGQIWQHVSVSRRSRIPSWEDMCLVHRLFIGEDIEAYQLHVPKARWISIHPNVLHLWACLDQPDGILPDFAGGGGSI